MSRVTIGRLYEDIKNNNVSKENRRICIADYEVVPRKIVEMIIERCLIGENLVNKTTAMEVRYIRNYAESLLKQFEEENEE